ncbi:uncharacterized protein LOC131951318 [Physella acuta]|uniref:uncharacterized protein LOC131951318 n=1 Tax=Physella acuta TaxID=109671 RepID=UPI0027DD47AF|nr:uncharacterized protein LOC131951318 [Physella acuta]XP_059169655.1 uncharacterized protein LOC131951318 [Physella acuta]
MAPSKQVATQRAKHTTRSKKTGLAKARAAKLAKKVQMQHDALAVPVESPGTSSQDTVIPVKESASKRKLNFAASSSQEKPDVEVPTNDTLSTYALVDLSNLGNLFSELSCNVCFEKLVLSCEKRAGSVLMLRVACSKCKMLHASTATSKTLSESKHYEINRRLVASFLNVGVGYAGMNAFCEAMGMDSMECKTYTAHLNDIHAKNLVFAEKVKADAIHTVKKKYGSGGADTLDLTVSFDGTWHKRGHTSKHGLGVVIETTTGLAVDFHVMSTHCPLCSTTGRTKKSESLAAYQEWYEDHKADCNINHTGSSGLMEAEAAKTMWKRSQDNGLRYTKFVSDGDCKTYNELLSLSPYDVPITKEECTNHVSKRLGTALRNLVAAEAKNGRTIGGRKAGSLTQAKMNLLQRYYKKAVASKCSNVEELRKKIFMSFYHAASSDEVPNHHDCPTGVQSWCFWQRAMALGQTPPSHAGKSSCFLSEVVAEKVKPIYERLTSDSLLERCLSGMTQNANESIHAKIWARIPKHIFVSKKRVEVGTALSIAEFNSGSVGLHQFLENIGCKVGGVTLKKGKKRDILRVSKAEKKEGIEAKRRRKQIVNARLIVEQQFFNSEGGKSYSAGNF